MSIARLRLTWRNLSLEDFKSNSIILNDINGETETGQFLSIMGPSGAGKSSLLSILSCRLRKDNTKLTINGDVLMMLVRFI
jgi:ABC-type lipoprotein export system ATPase subunit